MNATLEILGSGGAITIPKPLCGCHICEEAREKGYPYKRTAPSIFIHGPDILFDTPEEIKEQLERAKIKNINAAFYSHWHPDHTAGSRVWEMNKGPRKDLSVAVRTTPIYLTENVAETFKTRLALADKFKLYEKNNAVKVHIIPVEETVTIDNASVTPFLLAEEYAVGFDIRIQDKKILLIIDESFKWQPPRKYQDYDLVVLPLGVMEYHPLTDERMVPETHPLLKTEPTFRDTLEMVKQLKAKRLILSHIEETDQLSHDDLLAMQKHLAGQGVNVEIAFDGMKIPL